MRSFLSRLLVAGVVLSALVALGVMTARRAPPVPNPNGFDRLLALGTPIPDAVRTLGNSTTNATALAEFAHAHSNLVSDVIAAQALPSQVPVTYSPADVQRAMGDGMVLRRLEKALLVIAQQQQAGGDLPAATRTRLAAVELGQHCARGGLLVHFMLGSAIQMYSIAQLSNSIPLLDPNLRRTTADSLAALRARQEPFAECVRRERRWMWAGSGWWKDWRTAISLPTAFVHAGKQMSFAGSPAQRRQELEQTYLRTVSALRSRAQTAEHP